MTSHAKGEKSRGNGEEGGGVLCLTVRYEPHLTPDEHRPKIKTWLSFDHHKGNAGRWTVTKKLFQKGARTSSGFTAVFYVPMPSKADLPVLPLDAAIIFQVNTKMTDAHEDPGGEENYEKDGSAKVYLAQLFAGNKGRPTRTAIEVPLVVQACIIERSEPVIKGKLYVALAAKGTDVRRRIVFAPPSRWDVVPGNVKNLQADIFTLIQRNLIIFDDKIMKQAGVKLDLSLPEGKRVHAPLFVNATGLVAPGERYFDNMSQHGTRWDEGFFVRILDISLSRVGWTRQRYVAAVHAQHAATTTSGDWVEYVTALRITGQALTVVSNSLPYIADLAEDDQRKKNVVESFDDPLSKNDGDCEDVAWLCGEHFRALRDGTNFRQSHVLAAQQVLRLYKACGALGTVTSRNIDEAAPGQGKPQIGSPRDLNVVTGAHMTLVLLPREFYWRMLSRTSSPEAMKEVERKSEPEFVPRHRTTGAIERHAWERDLPVMIAEGTGGLVCQPQAAEAYFRTLPEKEKALFENLKHREAFARLLTGVGPQQRTQMDQSDLKILPGFEGMQMLRMQDAMANDPEVRINSFFRLQTELFPIPERHEEIRYSTVMTMATGVAQNDPSSSKPSDPYSLRKIIPVQMGPRTGGEGPMTAGVNMADILNKRAFVGGLRLTKAHSEEMQAIRAGARHLPPTEELRLPSSRDVEKKKVHFANLSQAFGGPVSKGSLSQAEMESKTTPAFVYWRLKKFGGAEQAGELGESMRRNPLVYSARLHLDHVAEGVATVRLQARVVTSDMLRLTPEVVDKVLGGSSVPASSSFRCRLSGSQAEPPSRSSKTTAAADGPPPPPPNESNRGRRESARRDGSMALSLREIEKLEKANGVQGTRCLRILLESLSSGRYGAVRRGNIGTGVNGEEEREPSKVEASMMERLVRASIDVRSISCVTILRTDYDAMDVTSAGDQIRKMDDTAVDSPQFIDVVCAAYAQFRKLMDYLVSLFTTNGLPDAKENARVLRNRFKSCQDALRGFGVLALSVVRALVGAAMPIVEWIETRITDTITFAGSLVGTVADALVRTAEEAGEYLKPVARTAMRVVIFSSASVAVLQNMIFDPTKEKIDGILSRVAERLGHLLQALQTAILDHTEEASHLLAQVWAKVAKTAVWAQFSGVVEQASRMLGEVQDALKSILKWLIAASGLLGGSLVFVLMAITSPASLLLNTLMNKLLGEDRTLISGFPTTEKERENLVDKLLQSPNVQPGIKKGLWRARERFRLDEMEYQARVGSKVAPLLSSGVFRQVGLAWSLSGEISGWVVDGVSPEPTAESMRMATQYLGIDLRELAPGDNLAYRSYLWWITRAITIPGTRRDKERLLRLLSEDRELKQKIASQLRGDGSGGLTPEELALLKEHRWIESDDPHLSYMPSGANEGEEEEEEEFTAPRPGVVPATEAEQFSRGLREKREEMASDVQQNPENYTLVFFNQDLTKDLDPDGVEVARMILEAVYLEPWRLKRAPAPGELLVEQERRRLVWSAVIGIAVFGLFFWIAKSWIDDQANRREEEERLDIHKYWMEKASPDDRRIMMQITAYYNDKAVKERAPKPVPEEMGYFGRLWDAVRGRPPPHPTPTLALTPPARTPAVLALPATATLPRESIEAAARVPTSSAMMMSVGAAAGEYENDYALALLKDDEDYANTIQRRVREAEVKIDMINMKPRELRAAINSLWFEFENLFTANHAGERNLITSMLEDPYVGTLLSGKLYEQQGMVVAQLASALGHPEWAEGSDIGHALGILKLRKDTAMTNFEEHVERERMTLSLWALNSFWSALGLLRLGLPNYLFDWLRIKSTDWSNVLSYARNYTPAAYFGVLGYALAHNLTSALFRMTYWKHTKDVWLRFGTNMAKFGLYWIAGPIGMQLWLMLRIKDMAFWTVGKSLSITKRMMANVLKGQFTAKGLQRNLVAAAVGGPAGLGVGLIMNRMAPESEKIKEG